MEAGDAGGPVGVDGGHVHPRGEGAGERVEQTLGRFVDFRHAEDVVDVGDDGQAGGGDEVGGRVARGGALRVDVQTLDLVGGVAGGQSVVVDRDEAVKVTLRGGRDWEVDDLIATRGCHGTSTAWFTRCSRRRCWCERERDIFVALWYYEDLRREIPCLRCLRRWQRLNRGTNQEEVREVVQF